MQLTLKEVLEAVSSPSEIPFDVGTAYLFRTIGYHWLGKVASIRGKFLVLEDATWVADTGRYSESLSGKIAELSSSELEPSPRPVVLNTDHITDAVSWPFQIPKVVK